MNLISVFQVTHEGNKYLGWPEPATAKALYYQLTEGVLSTQPKRYLVDGVCDSQLLQLQQLLLLLFKSW